MYENKCLEVFEKDPKNLDADYYKTYFRETNNGLFTVLVNTDKPMDKLQFIDIPIPTSVLVDNKEWWKTNTNYYIENDNDITIANIPEGSTTVKIYFQDLSGKPFATFYASRYFVFPEEEITFYAVDSFDPDGEILHYNWDFGDGKEISGKVVKHSYSELGNYTVTLTVRDNDYLEDVDSDTIFVVNSTQDSDSDGVPDGLDPFPERNLDTDSDGLSDDFEVVISKTNKREKDTDSDGIDDKTEWDNGSDPNDPNDPKSTEKKEKKSDSSFVLAVVGIIIAIIIIFIIYQFILKKRKEK
jgi:PKD repeat protein